MKPKEETKPIENNSNNQSRATIIFNDLINKRKKTMNELYDSIDYNNLKLEYIGPTKDFFMSIRILNNFLMRQIITGLNLMREKINKVIFLKN